jgi:hypothetical protein
VSPDVRPFVSAAVGAALGAAVVYAGLQAKQKRDGAAVIDLYNYLVEVRALRGVQQRVACAFMHASVMRACVHASMTLRVCPARAPHSPGSPASACLSTRR